MRASTETENYEDREFLQGKDLSMNDNVGRPPVAKGLNDQTNDLVFMQLDCDYYSRCKKTISKIFVIFILLLCSH